MAVCDIIAGPVRILYAAVGTSGPADTVAAAGSWGASWTELGYTKEPLTVKYEEELLDGEIQEALAPVKRYLQSKSLEFETVLAELTTPNMALSMNGTSTPTAAGSGQPGKEVLTVGNSAFMTERKFGFEGKYVDEDGATFPIRLYIHKAVISFSGELQFAKTETTGVPLHGVANMDLSQTAGSEFFTITKILEPAT